MSSDYAYYLYALRPTPFTPIGTNQIRHIAILTGSHLAAFSIEDFFPHIDSFMSKGNS